MSGSVNKVIIEEYANGASLTELANRYEIPVSTIRYHAMRAGVLRSRAEGVSCLLYTSPSPRDKRQSRMPSSA